MPFFSDDDGKLFYADGSIDLPEGQISERRMALSTSSELTNNGLIFEVDEPSGDTLDDQLEKNAFDDGLIKEDSPDVHKPIARFTVSPENLFIGFPVEFDASPSSPGLQMDGEGQQRIVRYEWDLDTISEDPITVIEGGPRETKKVEHVYENPGEVEVKLTVENEAGFTDSTTIPEREKG